jgi:hypothetical protein
MEEWYIESIEDHLPYLNAVMALLENAPKRFDTQA